MNECLLLLILILQTFALVILGFEAVVWAFDIDLPNRVNDQHRSKNNGRTHHPA